VSEARSDDVVRRLRAESRLRIAGQNRWRVFAGWCAVATLASGISLAALDAHDAQLQAQEVDPVVDRVTLPAPRRDPSIGDHFDCN
jgi:hypothetical protein